MNWFLYDNGIRHERVKVGHTQIINQPVMEQSHTDKNSVRAITKEK